MAEQAQHLLEIARRAVARACSVTRAVQDELTEAGRLTKDDRSPVTVADFAAQAIVQQTLRSSLPGSELPRIVGEESAGVLRQTDQGVIRTRVVDAVRRVWTDASEDDVLDAIDACDHDASSDAYWTLDPVDGTKGFLRGGQYAISLARIERGVVTLGVMGCPNLSPDAARSFNDPDPRGLLYAALRDGGTWVHQADDPDADATPVVLDPAQVSERIRVCESVESAHTAQDDTARLLAHLGGAGEPARLDSQCKYAVVARGQADAYLRMPTRPGYMEKIWDHAAGMLVATEAGAVVTDVAGKPLDFSHGATLRENRGVICAHPAYHPRILEGIQTLSLAGASS